MKYRIYVDTILKYYNWSLIWENFLRLIWANQLSTGQKLGILLDTQRMPSFQIFFWFLLDGSLGSSFIKQRLLLIAKSVLNPRNRLSWLLVTPSGYLNSFALRRLMPLFWWICLRIVFWLMIPLAGLIFSLVVMVVMICV